MRDLPTETTDEKPDRFVPDSDVVEEFSVTTMTLWRWDRDPALRELGWPPPLKIRNRNFRSRRALESFKTRLVQVALQSRHSPSE